MTYSEISNSEESQSLVGNLKNGQDEYRLPYTAGNYILYKGFGDKFKTIVTDSITVSRNIEFDFIDCTDEDGRTYEIVKIW